MGMEERGETASFHKRRPYSASEYQAAPQYRYKSTFYVNITELSKDLS
jgi:hypothetical protein